MLLTISLYSCGSEEQLTTDHMDKKVFQDSIIDRYAHNGAHKYSYLYQMKEWQDALDEGLRQDSTIAYLWQQKAMPYFKARKYEVGMDYLDKAVQYDKERYLPYRAFIKCIFSKKYREAITDFEESKTWMGDIYEMDHTYTFYIALSQLMLNDYKAAEENFRTTIEDQIAQFEEAHHVDLFYHGISKYELGKYQEASTVFDQALKQYPQFSDALYYKALCLFRLNQPKEEYVALIAKAEEYASQGYSINEANAVYEPYPYQIKWN